MSERLKGGALGLTLVGSFAWFWNSIPGNNLWRLIQAIFDDPVRMSLLSTLKNSNIEDNLFPLLSSAGLFALVLGISGGLTIVFLEKLTGRYFFSVIFITLAAAGLVGAAAGGLFEESLSIAVGAVLLALGCIVLFEGVFVRLDSYQLNPMMQGTLIAVLIGGIAWILLRPASNEISAVVSEIANAKAKALLLMIQIVGFPLLIWDAAQMYEIGEARSINRILLGILLGGLLVGSFVWFRAEVPDGNPILLLRAIGDSDLKQDWDASTESTLAVGMSTAGFLFMLSANGFLLTGTEGCLSTILTFFPPAWGALVGWMIGGGVGLAIGLVGGIVLVVFGGGFHATIDEDDKPLVVSSLLISIVLVSILMLLIVRPDSPQLVRDHSTQTPNMTTGDSSPESIAEESSDEFFSHKGRRQAVDYLNTGVLVSGLLLSIGLGIRSYRNR